MTLYTTKKQKLINQVASDLNRQEGFREFAYPDPLSPLAKKYKGEAWPWGFVPAKELLSRIGDMKEKDGAPWTVGFGFTQGVTASSRMNRLTAERKLETEILDRDQSLQVILPWYNDSSFVAKTVLINMAFNLGLKGLLGFRNTLRYIKEQNYKQAAANMRKSLWYRQVTKRAEELAVRMETQTIKEQHKAPN